MQEILLDELVQDRLRRHAEAALHLKIADVLGQDMRDVVGLEKGVEGVGDVGAKLHAALADPLQLLGPGLVGCAPRRLRLPRIGARRAGRRAGGGTRRDAAMERGLRPGPAVGGLRLGVYCVRAVGGGGGGSRSQVVATEWLRMCRGIFGRGLFVVLLPRGGFLCRLAGLIVSWLPPVARRGG